MSDKHGVMLEEWSGEKKNEMNKFFFFRNSRTQGSRFFSCNQKLNFQEK